MEKEEWRLQLCWDPWQPSPAQPESSPSQAITEAFISHLWLSVLPTPLVWWLQSSGGGHSDARRHLATPSVFWAGRVQHAWPLWPWSRRLLHRSYLLHAGCWRCMLVCVKWRQVRLQVMWKQKEVESRPKSKSRKNIDILPKVHLVDLPL
jgi:hypothetical protein